MNAAGMGTLLTLELQLPLLRLPAEHDALQPSHLFDG
jgi:hypothetical protein